LREAINHSTAGDDIVFAAGVTGTITLTLGQLTIDKNLTIAGPGADVLTVSGNNTSRVFFSRSGNINILISGLTVADGNEVLSGGGGISWDGGVTGTLTINNCTFFSNESSYGGALRLDPGTVNINNCTFFENTSSSGGGALRLEEGVFNVTNCTFFNNTSDYLGGAIIATEEAIANISNCTFSGNTASTGGGGIAVWWRPNAVNIKNTIVVGNNAPNRPDAADIFVGSVLRLGPMVSADFNLFGVVSSIIPGTFIPAANDQIGVTAAQVNLGALAIEAPGTTATLPLQAGSIAIDGVTNMAQCTDVQGNPVVTDQRGLMRPQGPFCDIGAYEFLAAQPVSLDIKPQSCPNPLNVREKGILPVAILGTADLDVNDIDPSSVQLEGVPTLRSSVDDISTPVADPLYECDCTTNGADGFDDLELKFDTQEIIAALGAFNDGDEIVLTLTGNLFDGKAIEGQDCIIIKSKGLKKSVAEVEGGVPKDYALLQNNPNPFNPSTTISFALPEAANVKLTIYDINGREVRKLVSGNMEAGIQIVQWDATDHNGVRVASGIYIYRLQAGSFIKTKKMILMK
jgi:predicted outer membrane repeat protein